LQATDGVVRLNGVLTADFCRAALLAVNRDLDVAIALEKETGTILTRKNGFGNVLARDQRCLIIRILPSSRLFVFIRSLVLATLVLRYLFSY